MKSKPTVTGIGGVFTSALIERVRLRAVRELADRTARTRAKRTGFAPNAATGDGLVSGQPERARDDRLKRGA